VIDAWGAFYKATGKTATIVSGASRLLTNGSLQPPLAENWGTEETNRLSASFLCFGYAWIQLQAQLSKG